MEYYPHEYEGHAALEKEEEKEENLLYLLAGLLIVGCLVVSVLTNIAQYRKNKVLAEQVESKHDTIMGLAKLYMLKK